MLHHALDDLLVVEMIVIANKAIALLLQAGTLFRRNTKLTGLK